MEINFDALIPYLDKIIYGFAGLTILYITAYIKERAKSSALKKRNVELEQLKANHQKELESIKKDYQLDIEKRKHQYESKKEQYIQFFKLLDTFAANSHIGMQEKMIPINESFYRDFLNAKNQKAQNKAATVFSKKIQSLMMEGNKELTQIKQETNTIRLIANDEILSLLDLLEKTYDNLFEVSTKMMKDLPNQLVSNNQAGMTKNQEILGELGGQAQKIKELLIKKMREDLNEI